MFSKILKRLTIVAVSCIAVIATASSPVAAHASIQLYGSPATPGGYGVMFVRIGHGCTGHLATDTVEVSIPAGFASVRPQQISGWTSSTIKTGTAVTSVKWSGGSLPDSQFADFGISVKYPTTAGVYGLKVVQYCGAATAVWDGANLPTVTVAPVHVQLPGELEISTHDDHVALTADMSSLHADTTAMLNVTVDGKLVKRFGVKLDSRGDFFGEFAIKGKTKGGKKYEILDGASFELVISKAVVAKATLGEETTGHTASGH